MSFRADITTDIAYFQNTIALLSGLVKVKSHSDN